MIYFEQKAGKFGQAMAVPAVPLPTALIYAWSTFACLIEEDKRVATFYSDKNVTVDDVCQT